MGYDHPACNLLRPDPNSYGLDRDRIPEAATVLTPPDGLLIFFTLLASTQFARQRGLTVSP